MNEASSLPCIPHIPPYLVLALELVLGEGEPPQLPGELECGEDGVLGGEGDERRGGQRAVRVDARPGVAQAVRRPGGHALVATASGRMDIIRKKRFENAIGQSRYGRA